ncbi:MAG: OmpA family protein [Breznakibacter sp.]
MIRKILLCILLAFFSLVLVNAQNSKSKKALSYFDQAKTYYVMGQNTKALQVLDLALDKDSKFTDALLLKADVYHQMQQYDKEIQMIKVAVGIDSLCYLPAYFSLGKAQYLEGSFEDAIASFRRYERLSQKRKGALKVDEWVIRAQFAQEAVRNPYKFEPQNLGSNVNSDYDEYWPSLTADEQTLVFTVRVPRDTVLYKLGNLPQGPGYFQEDFYESTRAEDGSWIPRRRIDPPLNTESNEGAQTLSADGNWMFFTGCGRKDSKGSCDIYFSQRTINGWTKPVNIGGPVNTPFWETQPSFSADGRTLFFISNRSGGMGKNDVWSAQVVEIDGKGVPIFGNLKNLGEGVNTAGDESSPFIHPDARTLFFSSEGWPGMGNMDVFVSRLGEDNKWMQAVNLGFPINTANEEVGFVVNARGDRAYYSSDGLAGNHGGKDLYVFELPQVLRPDPVSYVKGRVFDADTHSPVGADFELLRLKDGQLVVSSRAGAHDGGFLFCLPPNQNYALNVSHPGYLFYSDNFDLSNMHDASQPRLMEIALTPIKIGGNVVLNNVFFDTNSIVLKDESQVELDKLVLFLEMNPTVKIELQGHTDNVGTMAFNIDLSTKRAQTVVNYLVEKGVGLSRLSYKGYGFNKPVADNDTEEGRAQNRRTEMVVVDK